jgi:hypothetical protein
MKGGRIALGAFETSFLEGLKFMRTLSPMWMMGAAIACGMIAFAGLIASGYAYVHTPDIQSVPIIGFNRMVEIAGQRVPGSASKAQFLFGPELFLVILALVVGYYALTRERFFERGDRLQAAWANFFPPMGRINIRLLITAVCWLLCVVSGFNLWSLVSRASYVLSLAGTNT